MLNSLTFFRALIPLIALSFGPVQAQAQTLIVNQNAVEEPFIMPRNLISVEVGGPARNLILFSYQRIVPLSNSTAFTARVGMFGFGNSRGSGSEAQLDVMGGMGLLLSTENEHNMEIEASYDRFLSRDADYRNRDQNRFMIGAGYRLQPSRNGKGFGMRVGMGMQVYLQEEEFFGIWEPTLTEKSTGFHPTAYLGIGYAF